MVLFCMGLLSIGVLFGMNGLLAPETGRQAGDALRSVREAQRNYLANYPGTHPSQITVADLIPYLPGQQLPQLPTVNGQQPTIVVTSFPPYAELNGAPYDPGGSPNNGIWNAGD